MGSHVALQDLTVTLAPYAHRYGMLLGDGEALLQRLLEQVGLSDSVVALDITPRSSDELPHSADLLSHDRGEALALIPCHNAHTRLDVVTRSHSGPLRHSWSVVPALRCWAYSSTLV